jgi:WD40 repeat protein
MSASERISRQSLQTCTVDPTLVAHLNDAGLELSRLKPSTGSVSVLSKLYSLKSTNLTCLRWSPHAPLLAAGTDAATVHLIVPGPRRLSTVVSLAARSPARGSPPSCSAVAFDPHSPEKMAVGFDRDGGLRDNGVVLWDMNAGGALSQAAAAASPSSASLGDERLSTPAVAAMTPIFGGAYGEGVAAVSFLQGQDKTLAVGTTKWLRIFDVRGPPESATRIMAHERAVRGLAVDPLRPHCLATFSDGHKEPINVWDIRKLDQPAKPTPWAIIKPFHVSKATTSSVVDVAWSPMTTGVLASIQSDFRCLTFWETSRASNSRPLSLLIPCQVYNTPAPSRCIAWAGQGGLSWQPGTVAAGASRGASADPSAHAPANCGLVLYSPTQALDLELANVSSFEALSVSTAGRIASARGSAVHFASSASSESDVSTQLQIRADAGYSIDVGRNLQIVSDEMDMVAGQKQQELAQLFQMWTWVSRVEQLRSRQRWSRPGAVTTSTQMSWDLTDSGAQSLLESGASSAGEQGSDEDSFWDSSLSCTVYRSGGRQLVLQACGWGALQESSGSGGIDGGDEGDPSALEQAMQDSEAVGDYERSAALAVFHGELRAAVGALKKAQEFLCQDFAGGKRYTDEDDVQQLLQLVAMSIAGYSNPPPTGIQDTGGENTLWQEMCHTLLRHPLLIEPRRTEHPYLRTICVFLMCVSELFAARGDASVLPAETRWFNEILYDEQLSLEDRTALACRFLPSGELQGFLDYQISYTIEYGRLEGIMVLGLGPKGQDLLQVSCFDLCFLSYGNWCSRLSLNTLLTRQAYLDRTGDVQTVALLGSRVGTVQSSASNRLSEWVEVYRDVLDGWRLWEARALLDVGRADLMRQIAEMKRGDSDQPGAHAAASEDTAPSIRPGLFVRCNYCNQPLSLLQLCQQPKLRMETWLKSQKPVLSCCPSCRNHLPRCYVCLLSLGSINPYMEQKRQQTASKPTVKRRDVQVKEMSTLNFSEWFTWCQICKHGGHADHILQWFETHNTCGVSGCNCPCASL